MPAPHATKGVKVSLGWPAPWLPMNIITDRVRSTRGGNVFTLFTIWGGGGGGYLLSGQDGGGGRGVPTFPGLGGGGGVVPTLRSGWGGVPTQVGGGGYLPRVIGYLR